MNKLYVLLVSLILTSLSVSCKKEIDKVDPVPTDVSKPDSSASPQPSEQAGAVTPVGNAVGVLTTVTIGPAGGRIESDDQRIRVDIPAGALTASQTISVQAIDQNYCPGGIGSAFRLLPHGLTFAKPATITIQYDNEAITGSAPQFLRIAYQNDRHSWQSPATSQIDTVAHTLSVKTTHFSDWTAFENLSIVVTSHIVAPGASVGLTVKQRIKTELQTEEEKGDLVIPMPDATPTLDQKYITKWTASEGIPPAGAVAKGTYYAPSRIPDRNPVAITVFLNKSVTIAGHVFRDLRLTDYVMVAPEGISIQVDGGDWRTFPGGANLINPQKVLSGKLGAESILIGWTGQTNGYYRWTMGTEVSFLWQAALKIYQNRYFVKPNLHVSGGGIQIFDHEDGNRVGGTFSLSPAGWSEATQSGGSTGSVAIKGVFLLKKE